MLWSHAASGTDTEGLKESFCPAAGLMSSEVQQKWQKWGNQGSDRKMWLDTAGTKGGSLRLQSVLIFPREKAEH